MPTGANQYALAARVLGDVLAQRSINASLPALPR